MISNHLKVSWRNLIKNKVFSAINIVGLAIGLSCFLLIALYVLDELSYDRFYPDVDNIYRVNTDVKFGGSNLHFSQTADMLGSTLKKDYPQVVQYTRVFTNNGNKLIKKGNSYIDEQHVAHADSTFFSVFQLPSVAGSLSTALNEP